VPSAADLEGPAVLMGLFEETDALMEKVRGGGMQLEFGIMSTDLCILNN